MRDEKMDSIVATINSLAYAIEARDPYTRGHSERVTTYAVRLAEYMSLGKKKTQLLRYCCRLHDVGKIGVSDNVLLKPGSLTLEERAQIELHPVYGAEILGDLKFIASGVPIILHHHERFDGKGYPYGLKKEKIPIEVRIIAIADAFDAMTSDRPYRKALTMPAVIEEIKKNAGTQFDPKLAKAFLKIIAIASAVPTVAPAFRLSLSGRVKNGAHSNGNGRSH
jgi:HD-GYP domain-containing protein (c-di-GMP phosphodiesterase class II)